MTELGNPFLQSIGVIVQSWREGEIELHLRIRSEFNNRSDRVHGGVLCTLLDAALGYAGLFTLPGAPVAHSVTLSMTTNFLDSGAGTVLVARGRMARKGQSIYFSEAQAWLDETLLVATAMGTYKYISHRRTVGKVDR